MQKLANSQVVRKIIDGTHYYSIEGIEKPFPSVTTILGIVNKPGLVYWERNLTKQALEEYLQVKPSNFFSKEDETKWNNEMINSSLNTANEVKQKSATFGNDAHNCIDDIILGKIKHISEVKKECKAIAAGFQQFKKNSGITIIGPDTMVYSQQFKYAGAFDALGRNKDGNIVVIDWKTSKNFHDSYAMQLAAYSHAYEEMTGEAVKDAWVVKFDKSFPTFEVKRVKNLKQSFEAFKAALYLWRTENYVSQLEDVVNKN